jgi:hypothetical protein
MLILKGLVVNIMYSKFGVLRHASWDWSSFALALRQKTALGCVDSALLRPALPLCRQTLILYECEKRAQPGLAVLPRPKK